MLFSMNVFIWMNYPSHHQSFFFEILIKEGVNLKVGYYDSITEERKKLGWSENTLKYFESHITKNDINCVLNKYEDYIHIVPGYGSSFTRQLCIELSKRNINWVHWSEKSTPGILWYKSYFIKKWYARKVNNYALGAFSQGVLAENDFKRWGIKKNIAHLSYSINPLNTKDKNLDILKFKGDRKAFLYLGQLIHRKGVDLLIKAFSNIENENWCLIIVGSGPLQDKLKSLIVNLNISKGKVLFYPAVNAKGIASIINLVDVFVLPSRNDGWGVVLNEATSLGKPIIASNMVGAAWHLIEDGKNGYRFESGNFLDLQSKMENYAKNKVSLSDHGLYSLDLFEKYSSQAMAKNLIQALDTWIIK